MFLHYIAGMVIITVSSGPESAGEATEQTSYKSRMEISLSQFNVWKNGT